MKYSESSPKALFLPQPVEKTSCLTILLIISKYYLFVIQQVKQSLTAQPETERQYWLWFALLLFLLLPLDILTTMTAEFLYGIGYESNPIMQRLLLLDFIPFILVHIFAGLLAICFFNGVLLMGREYNTTDTWKYYRVLEVWLGFGITAGLLVFVNNLYVIYTGIITV